MNPNQDNSTHQHANSREDMRARMREATRKMMSGGAGAATAAIQKALAGAQASGMHTPGMQEMFGSKLSDFTAAFNQAQAAKGDPAADAAHVQPLMSAHMPDFMRGMDFSSLGAGKFFGAGSSGAGSSGAVASTGDASGTGGVPEFVNNLLASLGIASPKDGWSINQLDQHLWNPEPQPAQVQEPESDAGTRGQFVTKSFSNAAGTRGYKVYIPSSYKGQAMPLMVMLHGCTQNADDFARGTRMNALAEEKQCFVVYPIQTPAANSSKCWNWFQAADQRRDQGEPSIIAGITREVLSEYKLDEKHVYVAGLSSGGAMAIIMGTTYPDLYAAVGVHSGLPYGAAKDLPGAFSAMRGSQFGAPGHNSGPLNGNAKLASIPIIVFHGDRDTTVHASNGDQLMQRHASSEGGASGSSRINPDVIVEEGKVPNGHRFTRTSHHNESGQSFAEHWVIHGAGHAWAGGSRAGSYTDAKGPDASAEMMRFFYTQSGATQ
ncbi:hypothetical protein BH11PSE11_BH11PSE11_18540 [soil metagenome]